MYMTKTTEKVRNTFEMFEGLNSKEKIKFAITIFEEWSNNQINSLNEANPDLLDEEVDIEIFNSEAIGFSENIGKNLALHLFAILEKENIVESIIVDNPLSSYIEYDKKTKQLIVLFSGLEFFEKVDIISELLMRFEGREIFESQEKNNTNIIENGYEIASLIKYYKKGLN